MNHQRAILVPGHGLPEGVRAMRFIPQTMGAGSANGSLSQPGTPASPSIVEIWLGDFYGNPTGEMLTSRTVSDRTEFVFPENEMPVVPPERSLVAVIRDPPARWDVEFDTTFTDHSGKTASRQVTIDSFGTAREAPQRSKP